MLSSKELNEALDQVQGYFREVNDLYITDAANQIREIGELSQSRINRLTIMSEVTSNVFDIKQSLSRAVGLSLRTVQGILDRAAHAMHTDPRFTRAYTAPRSAAERAEAKENALRARARMEHYVETLWRQTQADMYNLSNTTAIDSEYRHAVDVAVMAVSSGLEDYNQAVRRVVRQIGYNGLQVFYASGYHRRLDSAARMNVVGTVHQLEQQGADIYRQELGYNAVELSAHMYSARDHEHVQGHVFLVEQWDLMQSGLSCVDVDGHKYKGFKRAIGEWSCRHFAAPFDTRYSRRVYTDEQLAEWIEKNHDGCMIGGKKYTIYEASQLMRQIETETRRCKDAARAAEIVGDDIMRRDMQYQINSLAAKYQQIANASGLTEQRNRMTVEGFNPVKVLAGSAASNITS